MSHGDDAGLRLPPTVSPQQIVIVPIVRDPADSHIAEEAESLASEIRQLSYEGSEVRVSVDLRDREATSKRWEWTRKGVPIIIELGPRDLKEDAVTVRRRDADDLGRATVERQQAAPRIVAMLEQIQRSYLEQAVTRLATRTAHGISGLEEFRNWFDVDENDANASGFVRAPWSEAPESLSLLEDMKVSVRCLPFDQDLPDGSACVLTGKPAVTEALFAKAY
jgi:prolyl-tRNA synthetase